MESDSLETSELNLWTIGSIAIVAYCLASVCHEGLGHGGACLLLGGRLKSWNAIFLDYDEATVSSAGLRFIAAAGTISNLITGGVALALFHLRKRKADSWQYFLWLFSAISFLTAFGYLLFSGVGGIGDWESVVAGYEPHVLIRIALAVLGTILYFVLAPNILMPPFVVSLNRNRVTASRVRRLVRFPYLVGGITYLAAGLLNPYGLKLVLISAVAASFGGTSLLAWYPVKSREAVSSASPEDPLNLKMSPGWITAGAITLLIFVPVLGRGLNF